jgi:hypothetical protein
VTAAVGMHFEMHDMSLSPSGAALLAALLRAAPAVGWIAFCIRVKRLHNLGPLEHLFAASAIAAALLLPTALLLSPHAHARAAASQAWGMAGQGEGGVGGGGGMWWGGAVVVEGCCVVGLGLATMMHRGLQMACVHQLGAVPSALAEVGLLPSLVRYLATP